MVLHQIEMGGCGVWKITKNGHYLTTAENLPYPQICLSASVHIAFFIALSDIRKPPKEPILWRLFCGRFRKRGPCPQKVGSKPERREVSAAASVGLERSPQGTKTVYKRTVQAQRDFLRGGAVLRPSGARLALTKPAGETDPNGEAAFCAEKCGEPQGFAATWCARLDSNQRPTESELSGRQRRNPGFMRVSGTSYKISTHLQKPWEPLVRLGSHGFPVFWKIVVKQ